MRNLFKNIIILFFVFLAIFSIYFGSILPFVKSQRYIKAVKNLSFVRSLDDFKNNFDKVLNFYSPVGDEEVVKFLSVSIFDIISNKNQNEEIARALVSYIEPYLFQNNVRHLLTGGNLYFRLWADYGRKDEYLEKAEDYLLKAYQIGPKLPPVLYGLFDLYYALGETAKARNIAEIILNYWPEEGKIIDKLQEL